MEGYRPGAIERALQLAATGHFHTMTQIKLILRAEKYGALDAQLEGGAIRRQLKETMRAAASVRTASRAEHSTAAAAAN